MDNESKALAGMSTPEISRMIGMQIERQFDAYRMLTFWKNLLASPTPPEVIAHAICNELSYGKYARALPAGRPIMLTVNIEGAAADIDTAALVEKVRQAIP